MTDIVQPADNAPFFQIQRVFIKDISLEMPHAPQIFIEQGEVRLDFNLMTESKPLADNVFETSLRGTITATLGSKTVYLLEVVQSGIFEARNIPEGEMPQLMEITCPTILLPYLRTAVTDLLQRASLPLFFLPEVNWAAAYMEKQQQAQQGQATVH